MYVNAHPRTYETPAQSIILLAGSATIHTASTWVLGLLGGGHSTSHLAERTEAIATLARTPAVDLARECSPGRAQRRDRRDARGHARRSARD